MGATNLDTALWNGPRRFDDFEVVRPLGRGGMGQVFLGRDVVLDREVALKFTMADDPSPAVRARFLREARAIARLSHPNVVGIYRVGEALGRPYIAYEFVEGDDLDRLRAPMPWARVARIGLGLARGLAAAHRAGVLHRDIKPSNAMLTAAGEVKLLDFGLARLGDAHAADTGWSAHGAPVDADGRTLPAHATNSHAGGVTNAGAIMGTPAYLPPEAWRHEEITARSDLYALGLVLYELLTGTLPHGRQRPVPVELVLNVDAPPLQTWCPDVLPSFAELVHQCLARDPAGRPESAAELVGAIERICSIFVPAPVAAAPLGEDRDATLVAGSFERVLAQGDALPRRVYERLFAVRPDLRALFPADLEPQRRKLAQALELSLMGLRDHDRIAPMLRDLGRRHAHLNLGPGDYGLLGDVLMTAVRELDPEIDDEVAHAWRRAYAFVTDTMREPARSSDVASSTRPPSEPPSPPPRSWSGMVPEVRYAFHGDVSLAYQLFGEGPREIVFFGWFSHLELMWQREEFATFLRRLGYLGRVVMFDKRGVGLSDRNITGCTFEDRLDDIEAIVTAVGFRRPILFGNIEGGAHAIAYAALHPERVPGVILFGTGVRSGLQAQGSDPITPEVEAFLEELRTRWGRSEVPDTPGGATPRSANAGATDWLAHFQRMVISPGGMIAMTRSILRINVGWLAPAMQTPALLLHLRGDALAPIELAESLAALLPDARLVAISGANYQLEPGEPERMFREIEAFFERLDGLVDARPAHPPLRVVLGLVAEGDEGALASLADSVELLSARWGATHVERLDGAEWVSAHPRCLPALRLAEALQGVARGLGVRLRCAVRAGVFASRDSGVVAEALAQARTASVGETITDRSAASLRTE
jgi:pimeloyl-ACP methyl ester carboxylesterase/hemoglobin-like flavoprotein